MSNSSLISYTRISPNRTSPRNHKIDTITIHCVVGQLSVESIASIFASSNAQASSNYVIGYDGRIGLCVEEKDRSWCSSNKDNDHRAITIEVASDTKHPYAVNNEAYTSLINLLVDICQRNDIEKLLWEGDKSLIGNIQRQNMTVHRWFANKSCPGDYLYNLHDEIASEVNERLNGKAPEPKPSNNKDLYRVRKSWTEPKSQLGAFSSLNNAKKMADKNEGYYVFDSKGNCIYPVSKPEETYVVGEVYTLQDNMKVRTGAGTSYRWKKRSELTADGKKHAQSGTYAVLKKGTKVTCQKVIKSGSNIWLKIPSGYVCAKLGSKTYIK